MTDLKISKRDFVDNYDLDKNGTVDAKERAAAEKLWAQLDTTGASGKPDGELDVKDLEARAPKNKKPGTPTSFANALSPKHTEALNVAGAHARAQATKLQGKDPGGASSSFDTALTFFRVAAEHGGGPARDTAQYNLGMVYLHAFNDLPAAAQLFGAYADKRPKDAVAQFYAKFTDVAARTEALTERESWGMYFYSETGDLLVEAPLLEEARKLMKAYDGLAGFVKTNRPALEKADAPLADFDALSAARATLVNELVDEIAQAMKGFAAGVATNPTYDQATRAMLLPKAVEQIQRDIDGWAAAEKRRTS
jgi:hypothetical protein